MKALIIGSGVSGIAAKEFLESQNIVCVVLNNENINKIHFEEKFLDRLFDGLSFIVTSPGVSYDKEILKQARKRKIKIIGEFELGVINSKGHKIAITGTNGKTTTVMIIKHLLNYQNKKVFLAGNIGTAVTSICRKTTNDTILVLESSSFQLEKVKNIHFHIAAILNITPDHLNRHKNMDSYIKAKQSITKNQTKNQTKNDYLLLNADDEILMQNIPRTKAEIYYFSSKKKVKGCYVKNGSIYFYDGKNEIKLVSLKNVKLVGEHNISNILCAVLAVFLETGNLFLLDYISRFYGVEHRIEFVKKINDISFYNDSKATNIDSVFVALKSFKCGINLILGGSDKGYDFDKFFELLPKNVKNIAVVGETAQKILSSAEKYNFDNIENCFNLKQAINCLYKKACVGEIILLSPACASFDQFKNYEERGVVFKKLVEELFSYENDVPFNVKKT